MSTTIQVKGVDGVRRMLKQYTDPSLSKRFRSATKAGGNELKGPLKAESGKVSKRMARAVTVKQGSSGLEGASHMPRVREPHAFVGYRTKAAFFANMVLGGTKAHGPKRAGLMVFRAKGGGIVRTRHVRGVRPNPIVSRVAASHEAAVYSAIWRDLDRTENP